MSRLEELRSARRTAELAVLAAVQAWVKAKGLPPEHNAATWLTAIFGEYQRAEQEYAVEVERICAEPESRTPGGFLR